MRSNHLAFVTLALSTCFLRGACGKDGADFWAFQPLLDSVPPAVSSLRSATNAIDTFILRELAANELEMAPEADRQALLRRATFDLTGLPPAPEEIDTFLNDQSRQAYERVIDRLLASPRYGERWGQHWLDLVRYADTSGNSGDFPVPTAWKYRNCVIDVFNADVPYDQFVREQLAGDLLSARSDIERHRNTIATGYLAISRRFGVEEKQFHLTIEDTITNVGQTFLGLSIHCARCHDHKFDDITNEDYYALYGIFQSTRYAFPERKSSRRPKISSLWSTTSRWKTLSDLSKRK